VVKPGRLLKATIGATPRCMHFGEVVKRDRSVTAARTGLFQAVDAPPPPACL
jgi:hypothetical protein